MKKLFTLCILALACVNIMAQKDTIFLTTGKYYICNVLDANSKYVEYKSVAFSSEIESIGRGERAGQYPDVIHKKNGFNVQCRILEEVGNRVYYQKLVATKFVTSIHKANGQVVAVANFSDYNNPEYAQPVREQEQTQPLAQNTQVINQEVFRPNEPVQPVQPAQPVQPVQPVQVAQPIQPVQVAQPVQPVQAVQPISVQPAASEPVQTDGLDRITMVDGATFAGTVISITPNEIQFIKANSNNTLITYPISQVSNINYSNGIISELRPIEAKQPELEEYVPQQPVAEEKNEKTQKYKFGLSIGFGLKRTSIVGPDYDKTGNETVSKYTYATMPYFVSDWTYIGKDPFKAKFTPSVNIGFLYNPEFKYGIGVKTGLNFEMDFQSYTVKRSNYTYKANWFGTNLSIPLQFSYRYEFNVGEGLSLLAYTGPVFDFGLTAGGRWTSTYNETKESSQMIWYDTNAKKQTNFYTQLNADDKKQYIGFNVLWGWGVGIQYDRFRFTIGEEFGMINHANMYINNDVKEYYTLWKQWSIKTHKPIQATLTVMF